MTLVEIKTNICGTAFINTDHIISIYEDEYAGLPKTTEINLVEGITVSTLMPMADLVKMLTQKTG